MPSGPEDLFLHTWLKSHWILRTILCIKREKEITEVVCFTQLITCYEELSMCCHQWHAQTF